MIIVDSHAHFYTSVSTGRVLNRVHRNFIDAANGMGIHGHLSPVIMVADTFTSPFFKRLYDALVNAPDSECDSARPWKLTPTHDQFCILAENTIANQHMVLIGGQQIVTVENLEALIFGVSVNSQPIALNDLLKIVETHQAIIILPWGFGKWMGKRGRIIRDVILSNTYPFLFMGDNGGRAALSLESRFIALARKRNIRILPGSDPLPFTFEYRRIGTYGFYSNHEIALDRPYSAIKNILKNGSGHDIGHFGDLLPITKFLTNQIKLRLTH